MKNKLSALLLLAIIQIMTAILLLFSSLVPDIMGLKTLGSELSIYRYVISSLYFSVGVLFFVGAYKIEFKKAALLIACVDVPLEIISYWAGFTLIPIPNWLIAIFSCIAIPGLICFLELMEILKKEKL